MNEILRLVQKQRIVYLPILSVILTVSVVIGVFEFIDIIFQDALVAIFSLFLYFVIFYILVKFY